MLRALQRREARQSRGWVGHVSESERARTPPHCNIADPIYNKGLALFFPPDSMNAVARHTKALHNRELYNMYSCRSYATECIIPYYVMWATLAVDRCPDAKYSDRT